MRERQLAANAERLRREVDEAVLAARRDGVPHAEVAAEFVRISGSAGTAEEHDRVVGRLRQRTAVAGSRLKSASGPDDRVVADSTIAPDAVDMKNAPTPYRRRIVEEWYAPPGGEAADVEDLNGSDDDDDLDDPSDHDLGDAADDDEEDDDA